MRLTHVCACRAFAGASAASDRMCISTNGTVVVPLTAEDICFCSNEDGESSQSLPHSIVARMANTA